MHRKAYFSDRDVRWNLFDVIVVLQAVAEQAHTVLADKYMGMGNLSFLRMLRLFKMMKLLRMVRLLRMFRELRLVIHSLFGSFKSMV